MLRIVLFSLCHSNTWAGLIRNIDMIANLEEMQDMLSSVSEFIHSFNYHTETLTYHNRVTMLLWYFNDRYMRTLCLITLHTVCFTWLDSIFIDYFGYGVCNVMYVMAAWMRDNVYMYVVCCVFACLFCFLLSRCATLWSKWKEYWWYNPPCAANAIMSSISCPNPLFGANDTVRVWLVINMHS